MDFFCVFFNLSDQKIIILTFESKSFDIQCEGKIYYSEKSM